MSMPIGSESDITITNSQTSITWSSYHLTVNRFGGKCADFNGDNSQVKNLDVVPISASNGNSFIYVCNTLTNYYLTSNPKEDNDYVFANNPSSIQQVNAGNTVFYSFIASTSDSSLADPVEITSLQLEDRYQLTEISDVSKASSLHTCTQKTQYCSGTEQVSLDAAYLSISIIVGYDSLPYSLSYSSTLEQYFTVTPSSASNSLRIDSLYYLSVYGIAQYNQADHSISASNSLDVNFQANFPLDGTTRRLYYWPGFQACTEFINTDMCGSQTQTEDIWIYASPLTFDFQIDCAVQQYTFSFVKNDSVTLFYELPNSLSTPLQFDIQTEFMQPVSSIPSDCTSSLSWSLKDDIECTQVSTIDSSILQLSNSGTMVDLSFPTDIYFRSVYLCSSNIVQVQHLNITIYTQCTQAIFTKPSGDFFTINLELGTQQITFDLSSLLATTHSQNDGPCKINWSICGDQICRIISPIDEKNLYILVDQLIALPSQLQSNTTVYLAASQNGTLTTLPIHYQVVNKIIECQFVYPHGRTFNIHLQQNQTQVKELVLSNYFHSTSKCIQSRYELCHDVQCIVPFPQYSQIKLDPDRLKIKQDSVITGLSFYIVDTANQLDDEQTSGLKQLPNIMIQISIGSNFNSNHKELNNFVDTILNEDQLSVEEIQKEKYETEFDTEQELEEQQIFDELKKQFPLIDFPVSYDGKKYSEDDFKMKITILQEGQVSLDFSPNLLFPSNKIKQELNGQRKLQDKNQTNYLDQVFNLTLLPSADRDMDLLGDELDYKIATYSIEDQNTLVIQIDFDHPLEVSTQDIYDQLLIQINSTEFQKNFLIMVGDQSRLIRIPADEILEFKLDIPQQLPKDNVFREVFDQMMEVKNSLEYCSCFSVIISYLLTAALQLIWSALNILQIISFMIISKLTMPAVTSALFEQILAIVTFDIIPEEYYGPLLEWILHDLPSDYIYHSQVAQAGFETGHILISMFLAFIFVFIFLIKAVYYYLLSKYLIHSNCCKTQVEKAQQKVKEFRSELIRLYIELCLDISVCGSIELLMRQVTTMQERISYFISLFLSVSLIIGLIYSIKLVKSNQFKIEHPLFFHDFNMKWKAIWEDQILNFDSILPCFSLFFVLRRFVYTSILIHAVNLDNFTSYFQLVGILILNMLMSCYLAYSQRFESTKLSNIELFNEAFNTLISIQFVSQLQISKGKQLTISGLLINFSILLLFLFNVLFVFYDLLHDLIVRLKNYITQRAQKKQIIMKNKSQKQQKQNELNVINRIIKVEETKQDQEQQIIDKGNQITLDFNDMSEELEFKNEHLQAFDQLYRVNKKKMNDDFIDLEVNSSNQNNLFDTQIWSQNYSEIQESQKMDNKDDILYHGENLEGEKTNQDVNVQNQIQRSQNMKQFPHFQRGKLPLKNKLVKNSLVQQTADEKQRAKLKNRSAKGLQYKGQKQFMKYRQPMQTIKETIEHDSSFDI